MKNRILSILLTFVSLSIQAMPSEKTKVDSICEYLSGTWYKTLEYYGFNGTVQPIYSGDTIALERIAGTDSLIWRKMKSGVLANYMKTKITVSYEEYIEWELYTSIGLIGYLYTDEAGFFFQYEGCDANGYGYARKQLISSVTAPKLSTNIQAFPNPTSGLLQLSEPVVGRVQILDASGRVLKRLNATQPTRTVDFTPLTSGLYFLQIEVKGKPTTLKIQKK